MPPSGKGATRFPRFSTCTLFEAIAPSLVEVGEADLQFARVPKKSTLAPGKGG
jgi:hypothetical protein